METELPWVQSVNDLSANLRGQHDFEGPQRRKIHHVEKHLAGANSLFT